MGRRRSTQPERAPGRARHVARPAGDAFAADRRGDILQAQTKPAEAVVAYQEAWKALGKDTDYRRLVEAKLVALGAAPQEEGAASGASK